MLTANSFLYSAAGAVRNDFFARAAVSGKRIL